MARVPLWSELRIQLDELSKLQTECYRSVDKLFDILPELDKKISILNGQTATEKVVTRTERRNPRLANSSTISAFHQYPPHRNEFSTHALPEPHSNGFKKVLSHSPSLPTFDKPSYIEPLAKRTQSKHKTNLKLNRNLHAHKRLSPVKQKQEPTDIDSLEHLRPLPLPLSEYLKLNRPELVKRADGRTRYLQFRAQRRRQRAERSQARLINSLETIRINSPLGSPCSDDNPNDDHHMNGLPHHLDYDISGTDMSSLPDQHIRYRQDEEEMHSLQDHYNKFKRRTQEIRNIPDYYSRFKMSEQEMRSLTARTYNRLPEVKRRLKEEKKEHMKARNYKNRLEYGRRLQENRRRGIINYPLSF